MRQHRVRKRSCHHIYNVVSGRTKLRGQGMIRDEGACGERGREKKTPPPQSENGAHGTEADMVLDVADD
jgi:hypothetical protein